MPHDIIGEWDLVDTTKGRDAPLGRIAFLEQDGALVVRSADPEVTDRPARVDVDGWTLRFELLSAGSSRGNAHHAYELSMHGTEAFSGTRRRGLLPKTPITGRSVATPALDLEGSPAARQPEQLANRITIPGGVAEAKARAAEAAERASLAAAEAAAALAEAEAAAAMEAARRAAETAAAARAAVWTPMTEPIAAEQPPTPLVPQQPAPAQQSAAPTPRQDPLPPTALANLPAPATPPHAFIPSGASVAIDGPIPAHSPQTTVSDATAELPALSASGTHRLRITHGLTGGDRTALAAEVFPGLFVWGNSFLTPEHRLREVGWVATPIVTDETIEVDGLLLQYAALVRDSLAG